MSNIQKTTEIRVYNEMPTQINLEGQHKSYIFPACIDGNPSMNYVEFSDIEFANSRSNLFSVGLLIFDEDQQEEIYNKLRINDWKNKVWFDKDIEDAIDNPTYTKMKRIIDITSLLVIERIRGKIVHRINSGIDVSNNVANIVDKRYRELCSNIVKSAIVIKETDINTSTSSDEVNELKKQLEEMKAMIASMSNTKETNTIEDNSQSVDTVVKPKTTRKKATVPKK